MLFRNVLLRAAMLLALLFGATPALAAQGSVCLPLTGTVSGLTMFTDVNAALAALISTNSGSSSPANACGAAPVTGEFWLDTSTTPYVLRIYDGTGSNWLGIGTVDTGTHAFLPLGAGTVTHTAGALTLNQLVLGAGTADTKVQGGLGTVNQVLHGNASGAPSWSALAYADIASGSIAAGSDILANTASKVATPAAIWASGAVTALTDATTIAVDMSTGINFSVTLGGNRTLGAPSNTKVGQTGFFRFAQDATGSRTLAYNAVFKFAGGTPCTLTTTASKIDYEFYIVYSSSEILMSCALNVSELEPANDNWLLDRAEVG